jgi:dephospho-CoA kinase
MAAQMPPDEKRSRANFVISNSGSLSALQREVNIVWDRLTA